MNLTKLWPSHGKHFAGGVELHCAGAQRNHGCGQRQIFPLESSNVTKHLMFGMMLIENRMRQKCRSSIFNLR